VSLVSAAAGNAIAASTHAPERARSIGFIGPPIQLL
jgi:hypothetical protein